jgi:hypothetical protein
MKYIKKFENLDNIEYSIGDIVACVDPDFDKVGTKYTIVRIYTYDKLESFDDIPDKKDVDYITTDQLLSGNYYVVVENTNKNNTHFGLRANRFRSLEIVDIITTSNKYNL